MEQGIKYLILKRKLHWRGWEFPKGGVKKDENIENAIKREVKEETGLEIKGKIKKFDFHGSYKYKRNYSSRPEYSGQSFSLYAVETFWKKVKVDNREHSAYKWLSFNDALKKITFENQKKSLKIVNNWLENEKNKS